MKIFGGELTQHQIDAGIAAMKGEFTHGKIVTALHKAGVVNCMSGAEVLLRREIRGGRVRSTTRGVYEKIGG